MLKQVGQNFQGTDYLDQFRDYLLRCRKSYIDSSSLYLAPYLTIFQSSGTGKSRLMKELPTEKLFISYICLRESTSSGYPPRSSRVADELLFCCKSQQEITNFLQKLEKNVRCSWNSYSSQLWFNRYLEAESLEETQFQLTAEKMEEQRRLEEAKTGEEEKSQNNLSRRQKYYLSLFVICFSSYHSVR